MNPKSPFIILQNFLSPLYCENVIDELDFALPDIDINNKAIKTVKKHNKFEKEIYEKFTQLIPNIETYHNIKHSSTTEMEFTLIPQGSKQSPPICENSKLNIINGKKIWLKNRGIDFTCLIFLTQYCDSPNFDTLYEVYGGKINFLSWNFGFTSERGTMIIYPSSSNFINVISEIFVGDLIFIKFHFSTINKFVFNIKDYPGDLSNWFKNIS